MRQGDDSDRRAAAAAETGARKVQSVKGTKGDQAREARVKAALKANIARRKAQARARDDEGREHGAANEDGTGE